MLIMGIDPGKTTGYVIASAINDQGSTRLEIKVKGSCSMWEGLEDIIKTNHPDVVVMEAFVLYPWAAKEQSFDKMPSPQVIGAVSLICEQQSIQLIMQRPHQRKGTMVPKTLAKAIYGGGDHVKDALLHVIAYCTSLWRTKIE